MKNLVLLVVIVFFASGCFIEMAPVTRHLPVYTTPVAKTVSLSPFGSVVNNTATEGLKLRPSPYGDVPAPAPAKTSYSIIKTVRVEFQNGATIILNNFDAHQPAVKTLVKRSPAKRRGNAPAKRCPTPGGRCPPGCCECN